MLTLYDHPLSPYAQKVKIALREKGLKFDVETPQALGSGNSAGPFAAASPRECVIERSIAPACIRSAKAFVRPERTTPGFGRPAISISFHVKWTPQPSALPTASLPANRPA